MLMIYKVLYITNVEVVADSGIRPLTAHSSAHGPSHQECIPGRLG
jgi:hypothetical protein